jgi:hypothetical protein
MRCHAGGGANNVFKLVAGAWWKRALISQTFAGGSTPAKGEFWRNRWAFSDSEPLTGQAHFAIAAATWRRLVIRHFAPSPTSDTSR